MRKPGRAPCARDCWRGRHGGYFTMSVTDWLQSPSPVTRPATRLARRIGPGRHLPPLDPRLSSSSRTRSPDRATSRRRRGSRSSAAPAGAGTPRGPPPRRARGCGCSPPGRRRGPWPPARRSAACAQSSSTLASRSRWKSAIASMRARRSQMGSSWPPRAKLIPSTLPDLREAVEVVLEARERRDGLRELVRRDAREHVVAREQHVVHLQADQARAMPRHVVHAVAGADGVAVAQQPVDLLRRGRRSWPTAYISSSSRRSASGTPGAAPEDVAVLGRDDDALVEAGQHAGVELVHREARARLLLQQVGAAEVVEVRVRDDAPVERLVARRPRRTRRARRRSRARDRAASSRRPEPQSKQDAAVVLEQQVDVVDVVRERLDAQAVDARATGCVEAAHPGHPVLLGVGRPVLGLAALDRATQQIETTFGADEGHLILRLGEAAHRVGPRPDANPLPPKSLPGAGRPRHGEGATLSSSASWTGHADHAAPRS